LGIDFFEFKTEEARFKTFDFKICGLKDLKMKDAGEKTQDFFLRLEDERSKRQDSRFFWDFWVLGVRENWRQKD
jgi:hypothetical protein